MDNYEFVSEKKDYSVPEFHDRFHKCLPKILEVNQGVCNDRDEEAFGKGEVRHFCALNVTYYQTHPVRIESDQE
jgi:hypothetical protein